MSNFRQHRRCRELTNDGDSRHKGGRDAMTMRADDSEALSLSTIGTLVSVAAPVVGGIIDHFTNKQQRDYFMEELLARSILDELD